MKRHLSLLFVLCLEAPLLTWAATSDRGTVYNYPSTPNSYLDQVAHDHFGKRYDVIDIVDPKWVFPKGEWKVQPNPPIFVGDSCISGHALVLYVISEDGAVTDPYVVRATHEALAKAALRTMSNWRYTPARIGDRRISSIAASDLRYDCPDASKPDR